MSAHDQDARSLNASHVLASDSTEVVRPSAETHVYYVALAERLENLLSDMKQAGTSPDDPLLVRLADLLSETRVLLRSKGEAG